MPIFEFSCRSCGREFEHLVRPGGAEAACPSCQSTELERLLSVPAVKSEATHGMAMRAAKKRDRKQAAHNAAVQTAYEKAHND
jgi:putative FmdB family regulatory protein